LPIWSTAALTRPGQAILFVIDGAARRPASPLPSDCQPTGPPSKFHDDPDNLRVNGGAGRNICRIDPADLAVAKRCSKIVVVRGPGAPGGGGGGGGTGGGGTGGGRGTGGVEAPVVVAQAQTALMEPQVRWR